MMGMIWVVLFVALTGSNFGYGLPVGPTPQSYPHDGKGPTIFEGWGSDSRLYAAVPALALMLTAVGLLFGCTWCYRHKDCKPNEGADNQLFAASATHLHDVRLSQPPDSGFSEPANNNISEDNNNGPISLREMQNIANNNAAAYIVSENEERNRVSRESVVEFEPLPSGIRVADPLEHCADWFGGEDLPRSSLQYLREIGRGWFGRVVEGEIEESGAASTVAVKILNQNASLEEKARFLDENKVYRDVSHENVLAFITKCLQEDPWILIFELCSMDLQQYLIANRPKMAILNEGGVPLSLMCDVASALAHLHSIGYLYGELWSGSVLVRGTTENARAVLGRYSASEPTYDCTAPETRRNPAVYTPSSEVWSLGSLIWSVCAWGGAPPHQPPPPPDIPCPYRNHLYQVMQLCWSAAPASRPSAAQVQALLQHLHNSHARAARDDGCSADFEERWQRLKPNSIPVVDEHRAIVHAPSTSLSSRFTGSDQDLTSSPAPLHSLSVHLDPAGSRSSSITSDRDPLSVHIKSESLTNLHGSLEDVRNIYLTHNEMAVLECHQGNIIFDDGRDKDHDRSDGSVDPWLKDIIAGSQDDVSYYKDVSDVIKNLDNILNSEKTSSSESSHQASPSRDNLSLDCNKEYHMQSSMVKSPGISNFQNIIAAGFDSKLNSESCEDDDLDRDTIGTLSHSFERHSDTTSQHTLENITPITPVKDLDVICKIESQVEDSELENNSATEEAKFEQQNIELPKEEIVISDIKIPKLKELCIASMPSLSETNIELLKVKQDCETPCDNTITEERTDKEIESKSVDDIERTNIINITLLKENNNPDLIPSNKQVELNVQDFVLPEHLNLAVSQTNEIDKLPVNVSVDPNIFEEKKTSERDNDIQIHETPEQVQIVISENNETIVNDLNIGKTLIEPINEPGNEEETQHKNTVSEEIQNNHIIISIPTQTPEPVQNILSEKLADNACNIDQESFTTLESGNSIATPILPHDIVQNTPREEFIVSEVSGENFESHKEEELTTSLRSDLNLNEAYKTTSQQSSDSTVYMDLINDTNSKIVRDNSLDISVKEVLQSYPPLSSEDSACSLVKNDSTVYLDLPSMIKETDIFLHSERIVSSRDKQFSDVIVSSTPKGSDISTDETLENSVKENEMEVHSETRIPERHQEVSITKLEEKSVPETLSPFESPTKSHHTDTYEENSSVVLGPFENCTVDLCKGKSTELVDLPKEELLAFSSNFSDINLETPSPLRDGNFLNEVPDIVHDDIQFDDLDSVTDVRPDKELPTDNTEDSEVQSATEKHISPSTPPNSPGYFLASTSQQKYLVDIDLNPPMEPVSIEPDSLEKEIDLNQIELQITTKLAMAENENNLNIEYSGPLTVEGVVSEDSVMIRDSDALPESFLAGNGGAVEDLRERLTLDEECVKALRNELELKLPLAQVASIEPQCEGSLDDEGEIVEVVEATVSGAWSTSLPPPPELILAYPGALSPIAEETRQQLSAYENDSNWNASIRTDSSESYPEPCNNSTDEVTELPTGGPLDHSTYTIHSADHSSNHTYTVHKDVTTSKEVTMSADSLNASPHKKPMIEKESQVDDRTYNKNDDEKESNCERISQESPFLVSPTTETSAPDASDNPTGVSTLSRTTVPTDAKSSKPSETQCLSKATSIDSWCSNDTLYNVEENFDDLAMDPDIPLDYEPEKEEEHSESSNTLTHNDDEKELSHCSTYIVHDSKSEACETFSPDSITANDNNTYTKAKTEAAAATPSVITKSEVDSTRSHTKDLAYGTLMSGLPSYSNCTTEVLSGTDDIWRLRQPELVRRSPISVTNLSPPRVSEDRSSIEHSPKLASEHCIKKMDSVEISCLQDDLLDSDNKSESLENRGLLIEINDSPHSNYRNMAPSVTSTPLTEPGEGNDNTEAIPMELPEVQTRTPEFIVNIPNFQTFLQSAEIRPQDLSSNASNECVSTQDTEILLEGDSKTLSRNSNRDSTVNAERTPSYSDFENSALSKPQDLQSRDNKSSQSVESGVSSEDFRQFETSVRNRPQDLSLITDGRSSSLLLKSERRASELEAANSANMQFDQTSHVDSQVNNNEVTQSVDLSPPNDTNLIESHVCIDVPVNNFLIDFDIEDETEQPHSIIITESPKDTVKDSPYRTFDSHAGVMLLDLNNTYDSHPNRNLSATILSETSNEESVHSDMVNGVINFEGDEGTTEKVNLEPKVPNIENLIHDRQESHGSSEAIQKTPNTEVSEELLQLLQPVCFTNSIISLQPHSIVITESLKDSPNRTFDSHPNRNLSQGINETNNEGTEAVHSEEVNGVTNLEVDVGTTEKVNLEPKSSNLCISQESLGSSETIQKSPKSEVSEELIQLLQPTCVTNNIVPLENHKTIPNGTFIDKRLLEDLEGVCNGGSEKYATVQFLNETFEELIESNVDDDGKDSSINEKDVQTTSQNKPELMNDEKKLESSVNKKVPIANEALNENVEIDNQLKTNGAVDEKVAIVTESFLQNEKKFCQLDSYYPLLSDIRFTGPAAEIMSTSFTQDSPTEPTSPECEQDSKPDTAADILKEWDSDSESHSSNSSSGEFIWKDGDGHETAVVPSTHFDHQRSGSGQAGSGGASGQASGASSASGDSGSGSEGDEVEFVPSSWDCRAEPGKSSLRSLHNDTPTPDNKKRVVFKRQKYHCVYEYPREVADVDPHSPAAYLPDLSTYTEWDPTSAEDAELGYGQLFGAPNPLDLYPLRAGIAFSADYDEDFFISSSARPFESLGILSTTSQFFPGMHMKPALLPRELPDEEEFPPPPSPLGGAPLAHTATPSLDFTTPDSGVEDITPGSAADDDYKAKLGELPCWRADSGSSSESVSPSSPGGEALGGLRHTRDKLKLDLPPSPHLPSPRHNRVFNFVLDKPKRHRAPDENTELGSTPLVMTDETPVVTTSLPLQKECEDLPLPEPTFSTFGKCAQKTEPEQKIILTDDVQEDTETSENKVESPKVVEAVKGEGTVLDSGDEDSGIESSAKATLERNKTTPNVS